MHKESIIKNLDMIIDHMQYKQPNEFSETHREGSEISEFSKPCKTNYEHGRISTEPNYTESRANPDHPHPTRQGGRTPNSYKQTSEFGETHREGSEISEPSRPCGTKHASDRISAEHNYTESRDNPDHPYHTRQGGRSPNSYNEEETNKQLNKELFKELTFTQTCNTNHGTQENSGSVNSDNYWEILSGEDTEGCVGALGGLQDCTSQNSEENCNFNMIQPYD
jgi:hypothetical protein